jgi:Ni/Co efflux regulator RcnB
MKKLMTTLLALSFLATTATLTFADDKKPADDKKIATKTKAKAKAKKNKHKKGDVSGTPTTPK